MAKFLSPDSRSDWKLGHGKHHDLTDATYELLRTVGHASKSTHQSIKYGFVWAALTWRCWSPHTHFLQVCSWSSWPLKNKKAIMWPGCNYFVNYQNSAINLWQLRIKKMQQYSHNQIFLHCSLLAETQNHEINHNFTFPYQHLSITHQH